jgi:hypothetical protein
VKIFFILAIQMWSYRSEGMCDYSLSLLKLFSYPKDIVLGGGL